MSRTWCTNSIWIVETRQLAIPHQDGILGGWVGTRITLRFVIHGCCAAFCDNWLKSRYVMTRPLGPGGDGVPGSARDILLLPSSYAAMHNRLQLAVPARSACWRWLVHGRPTNCPCGRWASLTRWKIRASCSVWWAPRGLPGSNACSLWLLLIVNMHVWLPCLGALRVGFCRDI